MSGHSKWATTKYRKGAQDSARAKVFAKIIRQVEVAAREGGSDMTANASLRTMYSKARDASVPIDTIERAIKRGSGALEGVRYESIAYEGYGPAGVAILCLILTDNRNRAASDVRHIFSKHGGALGTPGTVAWQFERKGIILIDADGVGEDAVMEATLEAGAEDITLDGSQWQITTAPSDFAPVRASLDAAGIAYASAELTMIPKSTVAPNEAEARRLLKLVDALEENDDVQEVFANFDISEEMLEAVAV